MHSYIWALQALTAPTNAHYQPPARSLEQDIAKRDRQAGLARAAALYSSNDSAASATGYSNGQSFVRACKSHGIDPPSVRRRRLGKLGTGMPPSAG